MNGEAPARSGWGCGKTALVGCAVVAVFGVVLLVLVVTLNYGKVRDLAATGIARVQEITAFAEAVEGAVPAATVAANYDVRLEEGEQTRTVFLDVVDPASTADLTDRLERAVVAAARDHLEEGSYDRIVVRVVATRTSGLVETSETIARIVLDPAAIAAAAEEPAPADAD